MSESTGSTGATNYESTVSSSQKPSKHDSSSDSLDQSSDSGEEALPWEDEDFIDIAKSLVSDASTSGAAESAADQRKSIYELDSYVSTTQLVEEVPESKSKTVRYSDTLGVPGVARVDLSPLTQKIIGCVIDENVTTEYPWIFVRKEIIEDNLDLHSESSDFLPLKEEIENYPEDRMLIGYAPTSSEQGQFYVCVSEEARDGIARHMEALRLEKEERVRKAVNKVPSKWEHLGSGEAIEDTMIKNSRPLFEIEVVSTVNQLKAPVTLTDRKCDDQRDGYVEIDPHRENFTNVTKILVDKESKAIPVTKDDSSQTVMPQLVNSWCQCQLDEKPMTEPPPIKPKDLEAFLKSRQTEMCKQILANTTWDVYANDYVKLAEEFDATGTITSTTSLATTTTSERRYVERQCYYDGKLCRDTVINDLAWHPTWTGVAVAAYTPTSIAENLIGPKPPDDALRDGSIVLVWAFNDCMNPKLVLESKRQVTSVSFCQSNGNLVIGGCKNGQIVIWDITGRIEEVEKIIVRTAQQAKHEAYMRTLGSWMKDSGGPSIVRPAATSSLQHSQTGAITSINWLSQYNKFDSKGHFEDLPADTPPEELSLQFAASSEDGSVAFWDLKWRPPADKKEEARQKKKKSNQPQNLIQSISQYKELDGIFKPVYMLIVQTLHETRNATITAVCPRSPVLKKEQVKPIPFSDDFGVRKYYKAIVEKDEGRPVHDYSVNGLFICTSRGEVGLITWEGFDFSTGIAVNKEICKWIWTKQVHDGPICHAVRSWHLYDVVLTIGGHTFAIWRDTFPEPILWRRCEFRYTGCCWDTSKPTVIILGRNDGTVEIWDIFIKSYEPNITQSLSGRIITGIYAHELPLNPQCVGFCDYNGALRVFLSPNTSTQESGRNDVEWMREFVDREVNRIKDFKQWQEEWNRMEAEIAKEQNKAAELAEDKTEEPAKDDATKQAQQIASVVAVRRAGKRMSDILRERWVQRELQRMERVILMKKGLKEEELEKRREPVLRMQKEAREKEEKRRVVIANADQIFKESVTVNFPHQRHKFLAAQSDEDREHLDFVTDSINARGDFIREEDEIIQQFEEIETNSMSSMQVRSYDREFSWRKLISEGIKRRRDMDVNLKKHTIKVNTEENDDGATDLRASTDRNSSLSNLSDVAEAD